ncbi:hypothetical protein BC828DRAFT_39383 [Blastocladiella britannica]|nr:hypothetical protein BC828DRAFT_39383 [Blastocladiella britannica]
MILAATLGRRRALLFVHGCLSLPSFMRRPLPALSVAPYSQHHYSSDQSLRYQTRSPSTTAHQDAPNRYRGGPGGPQIELDVQLARALSNRNAAEFRTVCERANQWRPHPQSSSSSASSSTAQRQGKHLTGATPVTMAVPPLVKVMESLPTRIPTMDDDPNPAWSMGLHTLLIRLLQQHPPILPSRWWRDRPSLPASLVRAMMAREGQNEPGSALAVVSVASAVGADAYPALWRADPVAAEWLLRALARARSPSTGTTRIDAVEVMSRVAGICNRLDRAAATVDKGDAPLMGYDASLRVAVHAQCLARSADPKRLAPYLASAVQQGSVAGLYADPDLVEAQWLALAPSKNPPRAQTAVDLTDFLLKVFVHKSDAVTSLVLTRLVRETAATLLAAQPQATTKGRAKLTRKLVELVETARAHNVQLSSREIHPILMQLLEPLDYDRANSKANIAALVHLVGPSAEYVAGGANDYVHSALVRAYDLQQRTDDVRRVHDLARTTSLPHARNAEPYYCALVHALVRHVHGKQHAPLTEAMAILDHDGVPVSPRIGAILVRAARRSADQALLDRVTAMMAQAAEMDVAAAQQSNHFGDSQHAAAAQFEVQVQPHLRPTSLDLPAAVAALEAIQNRYENPRHVALNTIARVLTATWEPFASATKPVLGPSGNMSPRDRLAIARKLVANVPSRFPPRAVMAAPAFLGSLMSALSHNSSSSNDETKRATTAAAAAVAMVRAWVLRTPGTTRIPAEWDVFPDYLTLKTRRKVMESIDLPPTPQLISIAFDVAGFAHDRALVTDLVARMMPPPISATNHHDATPPLIWVVDSNVLTSAIEAALRTGDGELAIALVTDKRERLAVPLTKKMTGTFKSVATKACLEVLDDPRVNFIHRSTLETTRE